MITVKLQVGLLQTEAWRDQETGSRRIKISKGIVFQNKTGSKGKIRNNWRKQNKNTDNQTQEIATINCSYSSSDLSSLFLTVSIYLLVYVVGEEKCNKANGDHYTAISVLLCLCGYKYFFCVSFPKFIVVYFLCKCLAACCRSVSCWLGTPAMKLL